jgi:hypothetical protein
MRALAFAALLTAACVRVPPPGELPQGQPTAVLLVPETAERETNAFTTRREDVEIDTHDYDRTPHVVAYGETPPLQSEGSAVKLYGDKEGTTGIDVDNFVLLELFDASGNLKDRAAVGFTDGLMIGKEHIDLLGRQAFKFEPGEIDLSRFVPEHGAWKLHATVLDYHGVGRSSAIWLRIEPKQTGNAFEKLD